MAEQQPREFGRPAMDKAEAWLAALGESDPLFGGGSHTVASAVTYSLAMATLAGMLESYARSTLKTCGYEAHEVEHVFQICVGNGKKRLNAGGFIEEPEKETPRG